MKKEKKTAEETRELFQSLYSDSMEFYKRLVELQEKYEE
jgi:hypothetical protein